MIEKVNPSHPDKVADRIAGAIVDLAYATEENPKLAVEVLIGHGACHVIIETTALLREDEIAAAIDRIAGNVKPDIVIVPQDAHLSANQAGGVRCGDNGIFKGMPLTPEQVLLSNIAHQIYENWSWNTAERQSTRSVTGPVARMWIPALPTGSSAATWRTR